MEARDEKWAKKWNQVAMEEKLTSCCKIFRSILNYGNIDDIFQIMKFSLGQSLPMSLKEISYFNSKEYKTLFPNEGNFSGLRNMG